MSGVTVSVCIPVYNGSKYIDQQIRSILSQLCPFSEIIIIDDCSTDNSVEIIESIQDERLVLHRNTRNLGLYENIATLFSMAHGRIIFLSDQDDIWVADRLEDALKKLETCDLYICDANIIDECGNEIFDSYFNLRKTRHSACGNFFRFGYLGCCMAMHREIGSWSIYFPGTGKYVTHDIWIYFMYAIHGRVVTTDRKLHSYRRHDSNLSLGGEKSKFGMLMKVKFRLALIYYMLIDVFISFKKTLKQ